METLPRTHAHSPRREAKEQPTAGQRESRTYTMGEASAESDSVLDQNPFLERQRGNSAHMSPYCRQYDFDQWYPLVEEFTFPTLILDLSMEQGKALAHQSQVHKLNRQLGNAEDIRGPAGGDPVLLALQETLQSHLEMRGWHETGSFVRLSSRSPKDASLLREHPKYFALLSAELRKVSSGLDLLDAEPNSRLHALMVLCC